MSRSTYKIRSINGSKSSWKPWPMERQKMHGNSEVRMTNNRSDSYYREVKPEKKRVTFNIDKGKLEGEEELPIDADEFLKRRNLGVSKPLRDQFKSKPKSSKFFPEMLHDNSETHASYRSPGIEKSIPLPTNRNLKVHIINTNSLNVNVFQDASHEPRKRLNALEKIEQMKAKLLAGKHVSMSDINSAKEEIKLAEEWLKSPEKAQKEPRPILERRKIFCHKGIVKVPTPHSPLSDYNTFGSPVDLRISLSNSDTPEFEGRRRFFFDFTGFLDSDIKLYLEGNRRLVIRGNRPKRNARSAKRITEIINLPTDLPVDNLRIVRDAFGVLIIEEAWKFV